MGKKITIIKAFIAIVVIVIVAAGAVYLISKMGDGNGKKPGGIPAFQ